MDYNNLKKLPWKLFNEYIFQFRNRIYKTEKNERLLNLNRRLIGDVDFNNEKKIVPYIKSVYFSKSFFYFPRCSRFTLLEWLSCYKFEDSFNSAWLVPYLPNISNKICDFISPYKIKGFYSRVSFSLKSKSLIPKDSRIAQLFGSAKVTKQLCDSLKSSILATQNQKFCNDAKHFALFRFCKTILTIRSDKKQRKAKNFRFLVNTFVFQPCEKKNKKFVSILFYYFSFEEKKKNNLFFRKIFIKPTNFDFVNLSKEKYAIEKIQKRLDMESYYRICYPFECSEKLNSKKQDCISTFPFYYSKLQNKQTSFQKLFCSSWLLQLKTIQILLYQYQELKFAKKYPFNNSLKKSNRKLKVPSFIKRKQKFLKQKKRAIGPAKLALSKIFYFSTRNFDSSAKLKNLNQYFRFFLEKNFQKNEKFLRKQIKHLFFFLFLESPFKHKITNTNLQKSPGPNVYDSIESIFQICVTKFWFCFLLQEKLFYSKKTFLSFYLSILYSRFYPFVFFTITSHCRSSIESFSSCFKLEEFKTKRFFISEADKRNLLFYNNAVYERSSQVDFIKLKGLVKTNYFESKIQHNLSQSGLLKNAIADTAKIYELQEKSKSSNNSKPKDLKSVNKSSQIKDLARLFFSEAEKKSKIWQYFRFLEEHEPFKNVKNHWIHLANLSTKFSQSEDLNKKTKFLPKKQSQPINSTAQFISKINKPKYTKYKIEDLPKLISDQNSTLVPNHQFGKNFNPIKSNKDAIIQQKKNQDITEAGSLKNYLFLPLFLLNFLNSNFLTKILAFSIKKQQIFFNRFKKTKSINNIKLIRFHNQIVVFSVINQANNFENSFIVKEIDKKLIAMKKWSNLIFFDFNTNCEFQIFQKFSPKYSFLINSSPKYFFSNSETLVFQKKLNFLGFEIRISNKNSGSYCEKPCLIPAKDKIQMHLQEINSIIKTTKAKTQDELIYKLAPKIRQWGLEYQNISTKKIFNYCDYLTLKMIWKWTCRRHPKKGRKWIKSKYFVTLNGKNWVFGAYQKENVYLCLPSHADTMLLKHSKLLNRKSPYAGDLKYWFERL